MMESQKIKIKFTQLSKAKQILFPPKRVKINAPEKKGVYIIFDASNKVAHVGCTPRAEWGLNQRLNNHLQGQSTFVWKSKSLKGNGNKLREKYSYKYLVVAKPRDIKLLEAYAIGHLCPKHIGEG